MDEEIETIGAEAKSSFDVIARLKGRSLRGGTITLYWDELAGEAHQKAVQEHLAADSATDSAEKQKAVDAALEKLMESKLVFHLRAVPEIGNKAASRAALKRYRSKVDKKVPEEDMKDFQDYFRAHMLSQTITKIVDADGAESSTDLTPEAVLELQDFLPANQWEALAKFLDEIQYRQVIAESLTDTVDF